ncbi:MAG: 3-keto-disaccharide hydrolase [Akkermansiaceae bacterium]
MKHYRSFAFVLFAGLSSLNAEESVPLSEAGKWSKEKVQSMRPAVVTPPGFSTDAKAGSVPSDAVVFFDGKDLSKWKGRGKDGNDAPKWLVKEGFMEVVRGTGAIQTRDQVEGDCQWHIEWCTPAEVKGNSQGRGNSGVFIGGYPEVQVLDSFENDTYPDGQASSLYKKSVTLVNASRGPGKWQTYDVICIREKKDASGKVIQPGSITVLHNGIVTQFSVQAGGKQPAGGLSLQDHGNPVRYRNIWCRKLSVPPVKAPGK